MFSFEENLLTQRREIWSQQTKDSTLSSGRNRSRCLTWAWIGSWQTDGRADGRTELR